MAHKRSGGGLSTAQQAAKFLGVSVLAGVVLAGITLPAVGALGLSAKGTATGFDDLPGELKAPTLSQASKILDAKGGLIATVYSRDRTVVPIEKMSPNILKAIVDIEDARYYEHGALDLKGILRALSHNASDGGTQGASTLTQQYVKNVFVEEAGDDADKVAQAQAQTVGRKIKEMKYAIQVEKELGKKKILENYLNITFFGEQAYGIEAASERYFSVHAKDLSIPQAAMLAGLVQSPSRYDPVNDETEALKRRNTVLARMGQLKDITPAAAAAAEKAPLGLKVSKPKNGCITAVNGAGFFCDYVRETFLQNAAFGATKEARSARWNTGGLTIHTTLEPKAQAAAIHGISKHVYKSDPVASAAAVVEPGTGKIRAMAQSRPYGFGKNETQINLSVDRGMGGGAGYQPGSTMKPFTAAAALEQGIQPAQSYPSPHEMPYPDVPGCGNTVYRDPGVNVTNENDSENGPYTMPQALQKSINTYFVSLEAQVGLCPITQMINRLGMTQRAGGGQWTLGGSFTLGSNEASPLDMAAAYAAFAARGTYCTPIAIESATDAAGKAIPVPKQHCGQAMSTNTADTITTMLKGVVDDGTGTEAGLQDRDSAGKTGTTDERKAAWFVGYTPQLAAAVWIGGDGAKQVKMNKVRFGGVTYHPIYGATGPAPIWRDIVSGALEGTEPQSFHLVPLNLPDPSTSPDPQNTNKPGGGDGKHKGHGTGGATVMGATTGLVTGGANGGLPGGATGATTAGATTTGAAAGGAAGGTTSGATGNPWPPVILPSGGDAGGTP
ncbi:transglycosylase domain-containing protein [Streptomyces sp. V4-01]|uniref:Transglycosylase domain-containing protein n=1 Tax=Actinacidiphila polyblastidii TaxID=3110430 RepID=A0ABU7PFU5_9ACTN|nr:transglycosylase domain-containing protein [Streptomyces sp. V4-01]